MSGDYPDYTDLIQIIGADIMVPIDIQGAYIMMPVDIQAQYLTLEIDIVAQTVGNIGIDIKAQTFEKLNINLAASAITLDINLKTSDITLDVDISAQTVGNITIDIEAQSVGVYQQPEWSALQGEDKNLFGSAVVGAGQQLKVLEYTVTALKTFYLCQWGFALDKAQGIRAAIAKYLDTTTTWLSVGGGYCGNSQTFSKPLVIPAGGKIQVWVTNLGADSTTGLASFGGYEI